MDFNSLLQLQTAIRGCNKCRLRKVGGKPVPGYGPPQANLFVVGEAPNNLAEAQNIPFVGWTGKVLSRWLEYLGLERDKVYITNAVKCALRDNKGRLRTDGRGPLGEQEDCRGWLAEELNLIKPKVVLLIGWAATESVLRMPIYEVEVYEIGYEAKGRRYFAVGHPGRGRELLDEGTRVTLERLRPFLTV